MASAADTISFKKFTTKDNVTGLNQAKSSVQRGIKRQLLDQFPMLEALIDTLIPKKEPLMIARCPGHVNLLVINNEILFFNHRNGPYFPHLRLLHKYPMMLPHMQCDAGAIRRVFSGAHIMCPGLTSPGGRMQDVPVGAVVAVMAEGKQHAMAVGHMRMSTTEIREQNRDIAIFNIHHLGDGLWSNGTLN
eukprot:gnl/Spiro4/22814_TR11244_c0_g1_i1.p2 gnl/Spiro4/22814_TR11244_c0_g1~~gnl/Spiro4/22814_TR11244_c0_g1_i1.p2  ORF type:complete len:205 (+),score=29.92 gnl/Spiro4/22814_TR11244_c0_g1_i1:47-616(+)